MSNNILEISHLEVSSEDKKIIKGVDLALERGKVHVLMGPNGSGKSTLAQSLMGHPAYDISGGEVLFEGESILEMEPDERALKGIFLSFQYPSEIPGVTISSYLRMIYNKRFGKNLSPVKFREILKEKMALLDIDENFMGRYLNEGFSGGEKKRMEILQMLVLAPKLAILDETDSGLDIDAIWIVSKAVNKAKKEFDMTILLITHYSRILKYVEPDSVYIMRDGKIVESGGKELAHELEEKGYAPFGE
jgi:Fe-S cluster assembly ATP-binding protein